MYRPPLLILENLVRGFRNLIISQILCVLGANICYWNWLLSHYCIASLQNSPNVLLFTANWLPSKVLSIGVEKHLGYFLPQQIDIYISPESVNTAHLTTNHWMALQISLMNKEALHFRSVLFCRKNMESDCGFTFGPGYETHNQSVYSFCQRCNVILNPQSTYASNGINTVLPFWSPLDTAHPDLGGF